MRALCTLLTTRRTMKACVCGMQGHARMPCVQPPLALPAMTGRDYRVQHETATTMPSPLTWVAKAADYKRAQGVQLGLKSRQRGSQYQGRI